MGHLQQEGKLDKNLQSATSTWFNSSVLKTVLNAITINLHKHLNVQNARISSIETVTAWIVLMDSSKLLWITLNSVLSATQHAGNALVRKLLIAWLVLMVSVWGISFMITIALIVCIWPRMVVIQRVLSNAMHRPNVWSIIRFQRLQQVLSAKSVWDLKKIRFWPLKVVGFVGCNKTWLRVIASPFLKEGINYTEATFHRVW